MTSKWNVKTISGILTMLFVITTNRLQTRGAEAGSDALALAPKQVQANEVGEIMILMYHGLEKNKPDESYQRSIADFKEDLEKLYDNGFRLISIEDLINNQIKVEAGYSPVVLTFDDGFNTAFSLQEQDGKLVPKPDCAVDIINQFSEKHPDFGRAGVFFICGSGRIPFNGDGTLADRFEYLVSNGYELGNHTYSHGWLSRFSAEKIQEEMGKVEILVQENLPGYKMLCMSYPYGSRPKKGLEDYVLQGSYNGMDYHYALGIREGQCGNSSSPNHINFDPLSIPRVRGSDNERTDLGWCLRYYKKNPSLRYVSDGNPDTISVPVKYSTKINVNSLNGKDLNIYTEDNQEPIDVEKAL